MDWHAQPAHFKYGSVLKRQKYDIEAKDQNGNSVTAQRTRVVTTSFDILFSPENVSLIMSKYQ